MKGYCPKREEHERVFASMFIRHPRLRWLLLAFLLLLVGASEVEKGNSQTEACDNPDLAQGQEQDEGREQKIRMITPDELST